MGDMRLELFLQGLLFGLQCDDARVGVAQQVEGVDQQSGQAADRGASDNRAVLAAGLFQRGDGGADLGGCLWSFIGH